MTIGDGSVHSSKESIGGIAMPMRDRLLVSVAALSPCSKGKIPLQLPPPPPGMPASQVEKWRKEVAKIISEQQRQEMKLLKQREKEEEMLKRVEENMRAKVDKLAKKMQQQSSNMRRQSEVPLTQRWSPESSPETSPRNCTVDVFAQTAHNNEAFEQSEVIQVDQSEPVVQVPTSETDKENTFISTAAAKKPVRAVTGSVSTAGSVSAADEVAAVLAARRQRVEEAMQANDKRKEELHQLNGDRKQRDMAFQAERLQLQSFEKRIPNKKKLQEMESERAKEAEAQREAKELKGKNNIAPQTGLLHDDIEAESERAKKTEAQRQAKDLKDKNNITPPTGSLLDDIDKKRQSCSKHIENSALKQDFNNSDDMNSSDMDFVIDEIPEAQQCVSPQTTALATHHEDLCGIGIMIKQNTSGQYFVVEMFPTGSAAKCGLINVRDIIECIDGQAITGIKPDEAGNMIRGKSGTQVVLDICSGPKMLRARVGITRIPLDRSLVDTPAAPNDKTITAIPLNFSRNLAVEQQDNLRNPPTEEFSDYVASSVMPMKEWNRVMAGTPTFPAGLDLTGLDPPGAAVELLKVSDGPLFTAQECDAIVQEAAMREDWERTCKTPSPAPVSQADIAPSMRNVPSVLPGTTMFSHQDSGNRCGVGLGFEFQPSHGVLVLRSIAKDIQSPFLVGDYLSEVNGTCVASNGMLALSLLWGDVGTSVHLKMVRGGEIPHSIEASLIRLHSEQDSNLVTMAGGAKTCGIGVVLEVEPNSRCFYVKRVVHGGPAFSSGVQQGDLVIEIDGLDMRAFTKDQLPSLILGNEGSTLCIKILRAGEAHCREIVVTRFLDTAKAQQSNLTASTLLTFDLMESVGSCVDTDKLLSSLQADIVSALQTVTKRIQVVSLSRQSGLANVYILPDFEGTDSRSVEELVHDFVYQSSNQLSMLRQKSTCKSLSKITLLGQVDPFQSKLDIDSASSMVLHQQQAKQTCKSTVIMKSADPLSAQPVLNEYLADVSVSTADSTSHMLSPRVIPTVCVSTSDSPAHMLSPKVIPTVCVSLIMADKDMRHEREMADNKNMRREPEIVENILLKKSFDSNDETSNSGVNDPDEAFQHVVQKQVGQAKRLPDDDLTVKEPYNDATMHDHEHCSDAVENGQPAVESPIVDNAESVHQEPEIDLESSCIAPSYPTEATIQDHDELETSNATLTVEDDFPIIEFTKKETNKVQRSAPPGVMHSSHRYADISDKVEHGEPAVESPDTNNAESGDQQPEFDLPIGKMLLECLGHPQMQSSFSETSSDVIEALSKEPVSEQATEDLPSVEEVHAQEPLTVTESLLVDPVEKVKTEHNREIQSSFSQTSSDVIEALPKVPVSKHATEDLLSVENVHAQVPLTVTEDVPFDPVENVKAEHTWDVAESTISMPLAGSSLDVIETLDSSLLSVLEDTSMEMGSFMQTLTPSIAEQDVMKTKEIAVSTAMGSDAWYVGDLPKDDKSANRAFPRTSAQIKPACVSHQLSLPPVIIDNVTSHPLTADCTVDIAPQELKELHVKFPHRIPVVVAKAAFSIAPDIQKTKYLVPANITTKNFLILISKCIDDLPDGMRLVLTVADKPLLAHHKLRDLLEAHRNEEGVLHIVYDVEEGDINTSHDVDEPTYQDLGADACFQEVKAPYSRSSSPVTLFVAESAYNAPVFDKHLTTLFVADANGAPVENKNWIKLDADAPDTSNSKQDMNPLSLLMDFGSNIHKISMPDRVNSSVKEFGNNIHKITMPDRVNSSVFEAAPLTERLARAASARSSVFEAAPLAGVGLKIERDVSGRGFRVTGVAPDGAAGKSGLIKVNDFLIAVDSVVVKDKSTTEAANLLKGPEGSKVQMQLLRSDGKIQVVSLIRTAVARQGKVTVTDSARTASLSASRAPEKNVAVKDDKISLFGLRF